MNIKNATLTVTQRHAQKLNYMANIYACTMEIILHPADSGPDKQNLSIKLLIFSYPSVCTCVLGAQKNHLIEKVLLSTHNICFS